MKVDIDIRTMLNGTPTHLVGKDIYNYDSVIVADFVVDGKVYTVNTVFELDNGIKEPVITNADGIIINKIKGV